MKSNIYLKAKLLSLFVVVMLLSATIKGQALQATGGTGTLRNQIWWADFSGVSIASGGTLSRNFNIGNIVVTVTLSNVSFSGAKAVAPTTDLTPVRLVGYKSGTWRQDGLDNLYNIGGTGPSNTLTNALSTNFAGNTTNTPNQALISNFRVTAYATLNGQPVSLALVYSSAEADGVQPAPPTNNPVGSEYTQGTTNGSAWRLIERFTTNNDANGNRFIRFSNSELTALMSMGSSTQGTSEANAVPSNVAILHTGKSSTSSINPLVVDASMLSGGSSAMAIGFIVGVDTGDLPATYGSSRNSIIPSVSGGTNPNPGATTSVYLANGLASPTPIINPGSLVNPINLKIGINAADTDVATVNTATANGDDTAGIDDEDGLDGVIIGALYPGLTTYSLNNIPVTNTTGSSAKLVGWVDFNHNGTFETNEGVETTVSNGATSASLNWSGLTGLTGGVVNIRLKISTDTALTTATPIGESIDGETEDYQFIVCTAGTSQVPVTSAVSIPCGSSTFNLASAHTGIAPGVSSLVWFTTADRSTPVITATQAANATVGTYYAFYFDATANCYNTALSTAAVTVSNSSCGYIYLHHQATNEEGSPDFTYNVTGGGALSYTLNDQTDFLSSEDLGASQSGRLWALARPVTDLTFNNFKIYYRDINSATWVAITTPAGSPRAIDGGNGSSAIYSTNAASGTTGRVYSIAADGTTTDITGNLPAGIVYDVSDNWLPFGSGGRQYASVQNGNIYQRTTSALPAVWTVIANTPSHRVDAVPKTNNLYYVVGNTTTAGSTIFYRDVTAASSINLGTASNSDDMAITEDGTVIAGYKKMSGTPGETVTWTDDVQGMYGFNVTGGPNNQFWSSVGITNVNNGNTSVRPNRIMTRTATGSWIDDERIRATGTHNDNSVLLYLTPGTYNVTEATEPSGWRLQSIFTDPTATSDVATRTATVTVTANSTTHLVFSNVNDVASALPSDCTTGFTENFGTTEANFASPTISSAYHNGAPTLNGTPNSAMGYGYYGLIKNSNLITGDLASGNGVEYTTGFTDHTSGSGRMLGVNATGQPRLVYQKRLTGLTVGVGYNYSAWVRSADINAGSLPNVGLQVLHPTTGAVLFSTSSGTIANANPPAAWRQVILNFTATTTSVDIAVASLTAGAWGNDFAVDDISVVPVKPTAPVVGAVTQPTCPVPTGSVALSGLPATGTWTITDTIGGGTITGTGTTATFNNLAPGTHAFTVQLSTCVSPATGFVILNNAVPPTAIIMAAGPTTVCPSGSVVLTASPATTYQWYNASGAISGATNQEYTATATGTYYVVETENGCTSANSNSIAVTVQDTVAPVFVASTGTQVVSDVIDFDTAPSTAPASASTTFPQSYGSGAAMVTINQSVPGTISYVPIVAPTGTPVPYNSTGKALSLGTNSWVSRTSTLTFPQKIQNLKFSMYDLDGGIQISFLAYNNGVLQNVTITPLSTTAQRVSVSNNGTTNASLTGLGGAFNDSARQGAVNIDISGPIDSVVLVYTLPAVTNLNTDTNIIADMSFEHIANTQVAATLPANTTVNCNAIPVAPTLLAADNCGTATVVPTETTAANTPAAGQSTITRTWTATDGSGNTTVHTQEIVVNGYSAQPTAAANQNICATNFTTLASVVITGTNIKWYADATTTTVIPTSTVLTNGATYYATQTIAGGCESSRIAVTVNLRNCSWINPSLRSKASK